MRKTKVEEIFDKYAESYSSGPFPPSRYNNARVAMSFADDITWHFLTKYLPRRKSIRILDAGGGDGFWTQKLVELGYKNIVVSDRSAIAACERFLEDHQVVVEPACGASLAAVYDNVPELSSFSSVLVIVCGGVTSTNAQLQWWSKNFV